MTTSMTFQDWVDQQPLSSAELAAQLGIHSTTMSRLYQGRHWPSGRMVLKVLRLSGGIVSSWDAAYLRAHRRPKRKGAQDEAEAA